ARGVIRELRHLQTPAKAEPGQSARRAALEYLRVAALERGLLPLESGDLDHLESTIESDGPRRAGTSRFRWSPSRELKRHSGIETTIVWCQQTAPFERRHSKDPKDSKDTSEFVPDVQGSSIRLVAHHGRAGAGLQITSVR